GTPSTRAALRADASSSSPGLSENPTANAVGGSGNPSRMTSVITVESTPPDSREATGTSDINCRRIAVVKPARRVSSHSLRVAGREAGANRVENGWNVGARDGTSGGKAKKCPGGTFQALR